MKVKILLTAVLLILIACKTAPPIIPTDVPITAKPYLTAELITPSATPSPTATLLPPAPPTAVPTATPVLPYFANPRDETMAKEAAGADFVVVDPINTGIWQYAPNSFVHPIALEAQGDMAYLLDGGRVLQINLAIATPPQLLLTPGDMVAGVQVIEPLDLALTDSQLLVLDRAGDVYSYELATGVWAVDRYARTIGETSSHYFVSVAAEGEQRYLLETDYFFALRYTTAQTTRIWNLPDVHMVDISSYNEAVYVLGVPETAVTATLTLYQDTQPIETFHPTLLITQPRQLRATETAVFVLDQAGERLVSLHPQTGSLLQIYQLPPQETISSFAVMDDGLLLAGKERLYFYGRSDRLAAIPGGPTLVGLQPHDPAFLATLETITFPVVGPGITWRDIQMPGAPRHYRLGVHEGIDFYWGRGTPIMAIADGVITRATLDYHLPTEDDFGDWYTEAHKIGYTSPEALDFYRGMQVWIQHPNGLTSRYAHLSGIDFRINLDGFVTQGQKLGQIGNSGSPASLNGEAEDNHLHFELWLGDHYVGQFLRPIETRELMKQLFEAP